MPIYTRVGDKGETKTFRGKMGKDDDLAEALGAIDELNSWVGECRNEIYNLQFTIKNENAKTKFSKEKITQELKKIQTNLMVIGTSLAGGEKHDLRFMIYEVKKLERIIDRLTEELPGLKNFIHPVGKLHIARSVCRRAERQIVRFMNNDLRFKNKNILKYMNRLSDALFTMARWVNLNQGIEEEVWE